MRLRIAVPVAVVLAVLSAGGCSDAGEVPTLRPPSDASPTATAGVPTVTPRPTRRPTPPPWPAGWNEEFCTALAKVIVAQELTVDVPRALDEGDEQDALALARELRATALAAADLLGEVPEWEPAQPAVSELLSLVDIGARIGRQYVRFLDEGRQPALERVNELLDDMRPVVSDTNAALAELGALGLSCEPDGLELETP